MKKFRPLLLLLILFLPAVALRALQTTPAPRLEISGVNASQMPTVTVTANVYDSLGQPVRGLTASDFALTGDLVGHAQITDVENISDANLPFAVVLAIDVSTSMIGTPLEKAKQAAEAFIQNIGENDPVAIITFANQINLVQDYTTDKAALTAAIESLEVNGETPLYQGAYDAVERAADSPTPRRAVILLSDGAEYGGISKVGRDDASAQAVVRGVPVYTIGLGFGADRTFLDRLSNSTNARSYESPTPDQLEQIYTDLAARLRSQYEITLNVPLPLDGTQYNLGLQVTTPEGTADATAALRAPIPVPIVQLTPLTAPISEPTDITATVLADDPLKNVTFQIGNQPSTSLTAPPFTLHIDPVDYPPGDDTLTVSATDNNGDTGSDVLNFTIAALPSQIALAPDLASLGAISEPQTITVQTGGQTATTAVTVDFNGSGQPTTLSEPYTFTIDPIQFKLGNNTVTVTVTNSGGVTSSQTFPFSVATVPPQVTVVGLQEGQTVATPTNFTVQVTSQEVVDQITATIGSTTLQPGGDGTYTIDPMRFAPGDNTLDVTATSQGHSGIAQVHFTVAPLPPQIVVNGLTAGETLHEDRDVTLDFISQSPVIHVAVFIDGQDYAHEVHPPYGLTIKVLDYAPGDHTLRLIADDADAQESKALDIPFIIAPEPAATATATTLFATQAAVASATQQAASTQSSLNATATAHIQATQSALQATESSAATATQAAVNATATQVKVEATATQAAQSALDASATQIKLAATATQAAQATQSAQSAQSVQATLNVQATATDAARATQLANNLATLNSALTATAQQAQTAAATATVVQATQNALRAVQNTAATQNAQATATKNAQATQTAQVVSNAQATQNALHAAQATQNAQATQTAQAVAATATDAVRATQLAVNLATLNAAITATAQAGLLTSTQQVLAQSTGTAVAQAAQTAQFVAQGTQSAQATQSAQVAAATQAAQATAANATQNALAATDAALATQIVAGATATQAALNIAQATQIVANATASETARIANVTQAAQVTLSALEATATDLIVKATSTRSALETQTASDATATQIVRAATSTVEAQSTSAAQSTQAAQIVAATADRTGQLTATAQQLADDLTATAFVSTATAQSNLNATNTGSTQVAQAATDIGDITATANAQATLNTQLTAIGPTATPLNGGAQGAQTVTPVPSPTLTEVQAEQPPVTSNLAPLLIVLIVIIVIIAVLVLIVRGRGTPPTSPRE